MSTHKLIRVREVMKPDIDIVQGMMTVKEALATMKHIETKALIVDKRHDDDEYGVVMLSDIAKYVLATDRAPERVNVYEVMSKPVICIDPEMDIRYCARLFEKFGLSRAPVVEHRKVIGIVSFTDMVLHGMVEND
jgi:signal-transduction protein with cAMP-binding, CBS, and nucleotidyltransferase domain